ncbi:DNA excision repair protein ERCC-1 [Coccomyxa sp. Obi]|nr:DNA excision repair protein ERCC-1 [Coccomyxa sp. Obi]
MSGDAKINPVKKRIIQIPSLQEVQAAQRPAATPPSLFRPSSSFGEQPSGTGRATVEVAEAVGHVPAQHSTAQQQSAPSSAHRQSGSAINLGLGIFSPDYRPPPAPSGPSSSSALPPAVVDYGRQSHPFQGPPTLVYGPRQPSSSQLPPQQQINPNAVLVSKRQEGNPVLKHIRNVRWQFADIVPDYQMGSNTCALFLSLRYHLLKPTYIYGRIKELQRAFRTRVLLCHVDVDDVVEPLGQVTKAALLNECILICAWSPEECARYLETYKAYESKPADAIQGRTEEDYLSKLTAALTTVRGVNKTDVLTLGGAFKTAAGVMQANMQQLSALPGIGPTKVRRLHETFHEPFRKTLRQSQLRLTPSTAAQGASAAAQPSFEPLPVDLIIPLDPDQDQDDEDALNDHELG